MMSTTPVPDPILCHGQFTMLDRSTPTATTIADHGLANSSPLAVTMRDVMTARINLRAVVAGLGAV
jgi:hypothetical protein